MRQIYALFSVSQTIYAIFAKNNYCIHRNVPKQVQGASIYNIDKLALALTLRH